MRHVSEPIPLGFTDLTVRYGDHVGHFYESRDEWRELLVSFLALGLERGDKCMYVTPPNRLAELEATLRDAGTDVDGALAADQLAWVTDFDDLSVLRATLEAARSQIPHPFKALRWGGEMTWLSLVSDPEMLVRWEGHCNEFGTDRMIFFCQYELQAFSGSVVMDALRTHPLCIVSRAIHHNPYYTGHQHAEEVEALRSQP